MTKISSISTLARNDNLKTRNIYTYRNNPSVNNFTKSLLEMWRNSSFPVDLAVLDNFEGVKCLILITNFLGSDLLHLDHPAIIRKPTPALFFSKGGVGIVVWVGDDVAGFPSQVNFTCDENIIHYNGDPHRCAKFDLWKLARRSKLWNCEIRVDMFHPLKHAKSRPDLHFSLELMSVIKSTTFPYPNPWYFNVKVTYGGLHVALTSKKPILQIFMISSEQWNKKIYQWRITRSLPEWMQATSDVYELKNLFHSINVVFLLVELVLINGHYKPTFVHGIHQLSQSKLTVVTSETPGLSPEIINKLSRKMWTLQMSWSTSVLLLDNFFKRHWAVCENFLDRGLRHDITVQLPRVKDIQVHSIIQVWKSILGNYTYDRRCRNGRKLNWMEIVDLPLSRITVKQATIERLLHYHLQVADPFGSYKFVVCGLKGSESIAVRELISVYDAYVWLLLGLAVVIYSALWTSLISVKIGNQTISGLLKVFLVQAYCVLKVFIEQGSPIPKRFAGVIGTSTKVKCFAGTFLLMSIILSNGYKNANVYKMVAHRKPLRYEKFQELMENDFHIYSPSWIRAGAGLGVLSVDVIKWFVRNISVTRESHRKLSYYVGHPNHEIFIAESHLPGPKYNRTRYWESDMEIAFNKHVQLNCDIHLGNVLTKWVEMFKSRNLNWQAILQDEAKTQKTYYDLTLSEYAQIEREFLFRSLAKCNKTALIIPSNEAESFARVLTPEKGNMGKEVYFQSYFVFEMGGIVTPPLLTRMARMKESGIMEWWANITEYISVMKFQRNISHSSEEKLVQEDHPASATLKGHIIVIFFLLVTGLIAALVALITEVIFWLSFDFRDLIL